MKPTQVTEANEAKVWDTLYGSDVQKRVWFKFQVGDRVRISKVKRMFKKSYLPNYTEEMFTIYKRFARQVPVYKLKDDAGEILEGTFYEPELQKNNQERWCLSRWKDLAQEEAQRSSGISYEMERLHRQV